MALRQCIDDLSKEPPDVGSSRELRTVELVDCMKLKGWNLVRAEVVVTS